MEQNDILNEEQVSKFNTLDSIYAYVLLLMGLGFIQFVVWNFTGFFTTIYFISLSVISLIFMKKMQYNLKRNHWIQFILILVFSLVFSITANLFVKFLNTLFLILSGTYWVYSVCREQDTIGRYFFFDFIKAIFIVPFRGFSKAPKVISSTSSNSKHFNNIKLIAIGLMITIPVTFIVAGLLISADSGVERMLIFLFGGIHENVITTLIKIFMGIPVAFYLFGMLYTNTNKDKEEKSKLEDCEQTMYSLRVVPNTIMYSSVTPICILYIMFFVSQLQYFVSAFRGTLPSEYSFAEYARRGFFELCAISIINLAILIIINLISKKTGKEKPLLLKMYSIIISVFTLLIIVTALSKMIMYISEYGLTPLRVYTSWFMILLFIVFTLIIIKQIYYDLMVARYLVISFIILFGILCFSRVDGIISWYNIEMYEQGRLEHLDMEALCNLSDDGLVYVLEKGLDTKDYLENREMFYEYYIYSNFNLSSLQVKYLLNKN